MPHIAVPVSAGELVDKITILELKSERLSDPEKLANVRNELELLRAEQSRHIATEARIVSLQDQLRLVNRAIWDLEDTIRECESRHDFGASFVATARQIYAQNDRRASIKREINVHLGSAIVEEKSYKA